MSILKLIHKGRRCTMKLFGVPILTFKYCDRNNRTVDYKAQFRKCGEGVRVSGDSLIYHPENIEVGNNVIIGQAAHIYAIGGVKIGNNVAFGPFVTIWTGNHNYYCPESLPYDAAVIPKQVTIESNVWIGGGSFILPGVVIGEGAVIGMGAVVTKDVPKDAVVGGNPARIIKYRDMECYNRLKKDGVYYDFASHSIKRASPNVETDSADEA